MKQKRFASFAMLLCAGVLLAACGQQAGEKDQVGTTTTKTSAKQADTKETKQTVLSPEEDYYEYVNADWMKENPIPDDAANWGSFQVAQEKVDQTLKDDFDKMISGEKETPPQLQNFITFYQQMLDFKGRDERGAKDLKERLLAIESLASIEDFNDKGAQLTMDNWTMPFDLQVEPSPKDATKNSLFANTPALFLDSKDFYEKGDKTGEALLKARGKALEELLNATGYKKTEAKKMTEQALRFDKSIAANSLSPEEAANVEASTNEISFDELAAQSKNLKVAEILEKIGVKKPENVIIDNPNYFKNIDKIFSKDTFEDYKAWAIAQEVIDAAQLLDKQMADTENKFELVENGAQKAPSRKRQAYEIAKNVYWEPVGLYYGQTYLGEDAKEDVKNIVREVTDVYKKRLEKNDWLRAETREKAIQKLDNMVMQVGYPDKIHEYFDNQTVKNKEEGGTAYTNITEINRKLQEYTFQRLNKAPDRELWAMSAEYVNAGYIPNSNSINFPAAILQDPFYNLNGNKSANYGGIGTVIGHEISHAFDTNGSKFDEFGSMKDWWTKEDTAEFKKRTDAMVKLFDGRKTPGGKVNGKLTLTENTADAGGISTALELTEKQEEPDYDTFYQSWTKVWRENITKEYQQQKIKGNVHAPNKVRANVQLGNLDKFYESYDVEKGDGMYIAPKDRVKIW